MRAHVLPRATTPPSVDRAAIARTPTTPAPDERRAIAGSGFEAALAAQLLTSPSTASAIGARVGGSSGASGATPTLFADASRRNASDQARALFSSGPQRQTNPQTRRAAGLEHRTSTKGTPASGPGPIAEPALTPDASAAHATIDRRSDASPGHAPVEQPSDDTVGDADVPSGAGGSADGGRAGAGSSWAIGLAGAIAGRSGSASIWALASAGAAPPSAQGMQGSSSGSARVESPALVGHAGASATAARAPGARAQSAATERATPAEQVRGAVASLLTRKGGTITLRLTPAFLGEVRVTLELRDGAAGATIQASTEAARRALGESVPQLRASLQEHGLRVERIEVVLVAPARPEPSEPAPPASAEHGLAQHHHGREGHDGPRDERPHGQRDAGASHRRVFSADDPAGAPLALDPWHMGDTSHLRVALDAVA